MRRPPRSTRTYTLLPDTTLFRSLRGARFMDHREGAGLARGDRVDFDRRVRLVFRGAQISSEGGLLVMRELDDVLGLSNLAAEALRDSRPGKTTLHRHKQEEHTTELQAHIRIQDVYYSLNNK